MRAADYRVDSYGGKFRDVELRWPMGGEKKVSSVDWTSFRVDEMERRCLSGGLGNGSSWRLNMVSLDRDWGGGAQMIR